MNETSTAILNRENKRGHFQYPFSFLLYIVTAILFSLAGPFIMLAIFLWKHKRGNLGMLTGICGIVVFSGWITFSNLVMVRFHLVIPLSLTVSCAAGIVCYVLQQVLVKKLFSDMERQHFRELRAKDRGNFIQLINRLVTWNLIFFALGTLFFLLVGMHVFPYKSSTKTLYLLSSLKWAGLFLIPGTIVAFVTNRMVFDRILPQITRVGTGFFISFLVLMLMALLLYQVGKVFPYEELLENRFYPAVPSEFIWQKFLYNDFTIVFFMTGMVLYLSLSFLRYRTTWQFLTTRTIIITVITVLSFLAGELEMFDTYNTYSLARSRQYAPDPADRSISITLYRRVLAEMPYRLSPQILYDISRIQYDQGQRDQCLETMKQVLDRYGNTYLEYDLVRRVSDIHESMSLNTGGKRKLLDFPVIEKETYTGGHGLQMLTVLSYCQPGASELDLKSSLKDISEKDDQIKLPPISDPLRVREVCYKLGYRSVNALLEIPVIKQIIDLDGMPVLYIAGEFQTVVGYDDDRGVLLFCNYGELWNKAEREIEKRFRKFSTDETKAFLTGEGDTEDSDEARNRKLRLKQKTLQEESYAALERKSIEGKVIVFLIIPETGVPEKLTGYKTFVETKLSGHDASVTEYLLGRWFFKKGDIEKALDLFAGVSSYAPLSEYAKIYSYMCKVYIDHRQRMLEHDSLTAIEEHDNKLKQLLINRRYANLIRDGEKILTRYQREKVLALDTHEEYIDLFNYRINDQLEQRIKLLESYLGRNPGNLSRRDHLIFMLERKGDEESLIKQLEQRLLSDNMKPKTYLSLVYLYGKHNRIQEMESALKCLLPLPFTPAYNNPNFWYGKGELALQKQEYKKARRYFSRAVDLHHYEPLYHAGFLKSCEHLGDTEGAEKARYWLRTLNADDGYTSTSMLLKTETNDSGQ